MRLKLKVLTSLSSTTAEERDMFNRDPGTLHEVCDVLTEGSSRTIRVATGTVDMGVGFDGMEDVRFLMVTTDREISLKLNGGDGFTVAPPDGWEEGYYLVSGLVESLSVSNSSGYTATVKVYLAGEPS